ncbi:bifunctional ornithine acetyltransferase/N-acetylglutamate synthase [cyanobacterium endosymbiont of Rhopalodia gibberula]|uniref:bifunctional ornithine acetyltransferase/N-acetylglutamate synthase n=1 Tax=cyanobacterium endosymbiont of Rhopalodia gibberula TaxID=1763363 RepID=UPI000DC73EF9|nr:bifunctional ornithine acetyltransferase/N-acetylglutamate synthase [cyanobacterium endosymbiont of Rhopalodia gibberula]BBA79918.1 bifunctional ornithine acetyltransferase/N-acetylglutamate synthase [cyanobacterium endosymbiont of Rhopalodia gibberula]
MTDWQVISGGITAPKGFKAAGIAAGLKPSGTPDLALIVSDTEAIAAGVFTTSQVHAACVDYCRQCLQAEASSRAIMCNAGQANAATGEQGWQDVLESANLLGDALNISPNKILLASTGVIGQNIRMDQMRQGIPTLVGALSDTGGDAAAEAIITTDLVPKSIALETTIDGRPVRIGGMAKGSGMIHPNMATMLSFITCDGLVATPLWQKMITQVANESFNQITVDGDTSTNDCFIALANGQSRTPTITAMSKDAEKLQAMLKAVCQHLAKAIARDGEGATCLIEVQVSGASDDEGARRVAKTIAGSSLVKSAIFGRDPNWGRIVAAAGKAGVAFRQKDLQVKLGNFLMLEGGQPLEFNRQEASNYLRQAAAGAYLKEDTVSISVCIGNGSGKGTAWGCDLSYEYVRINSEYTT